MLKLFLIFMFGATFVSPSSVKKEIVVSIDAKNKIYLNSEPILRDQLRVKLKSLLRQPKEPPVLLLADRTLSYEQVLEVMVEIQ